MGRGCTMDEWVHFERLPEEGRVPNSSYWYVHCRHCVRGFEQKQLFNPPAKLTGRRSAMKAHLKVCPLYATQYKMEQRALAAAAVAAAATASVEGVHAATAAAAVAADAAAAVATTESAEETDAAVAPPATAATPPPMVGTVTIKTQSGEKRKRRGEDVEASGPRGGRGKHCMMEEWEHFIRLQDEGYIGKSNFFFAVCRHCQTAYDEASDEKKPLLVPEKMVGRREKMRKHLTHCPYFKGDLPSLERRTQVRTAGPGAFLPLPTPDGIKMVPASALTSAAAIEAAGLGQALGGTTDGESALGDAAAAAAAATANGGAPSARLALDEWQYFTRLQRKKDSAYYFARCNFCQQAFDNAPDALKGSMTPTVVMGRKSNMQTHLAKCPYVPKDAMLFNKAVLGGGAGAFVLMAGRDDYASKRLKMAGQLDTGSASLHQILVEFLIQHKLPFEWVDSLSAKKLLRIAAVGAHVNTNLVPTSEELRGHILDDLVRSELQPEIERLKQVVAFVAAAGTAEAVTNGEVPSLSDTAPFPVVAKVSVSEANDEGGVVPTVECVLSGNGASVPLEYVLVDREPVDEDSMITGIAPGQTNISYYHGLDVARYLSNQLRRVRDDQQIATGVVMVPPSPVITRAVGLLRAHWPTVAFVWNLEDMVAFCLRNALQNPVVAQVISATTALAQDPEIDAHLRASGFAVGEDVDWTTFPALAQELLSERLSAHHTLLDGKVDRTELLRVATLCRALAVVNDRLTIGGRVTLVDTLTHLATLFTAAEGFEDIQRALEVVWNECEQPLYLLAHALHPHMRLRGVVATDLTKFSALSDLGVDYFTQFFGRKPQSLRGDITSFLHISQPVFTDAFIAEFPLVEDYYRYLRDNFPELAAFMQLLQSFSVCSDAVDGNAKTNAKSKPPFTEDEQKKLALLEERWGVEPASYRLDGATPSEGGGDVPMDDAEATKDAESDVVAKWVRKLDALCASRMVDFSDWEAKLTADNAAEETSSQDTESDVDTTLATEMLLPSQAEDDLAAYVSVGLKNGRAKKVRLAQLFAGTESTTV